ncbi:MULTISPECIES: hypothetical protein [Vibrio harveyi group]|uniref:hypothetical protein n=1 Tax=Vibrio harveyi group TaxID=717610 RepID=UPI00111052EC|nr:hypothetical protein [Vibrio parahaemolyticus]MDG2761608.1 hypothetical protein [Vibrio parahaemolyticus]TMX40859.1 hypothetical protein DA098_03240 [Vibrio parahaemolyticus]TMX79836.1 hypothetical protein DA094_04960 [Vibrio parahaemolyticus]
MTNKFELELKVASHRLINSIWTLAYIPLGNGQVHVVMYGRDYEHSYVPEMFNDQARLERKIESVDSNRVLQSVVIGGEHFEVNNQQNIFSYHSNLETFDQLSEVAAIVMENLNEEYSEVFGAAA